MHQEMYTDAWEKPSGSGNVRRWEELLIEIYTTDEKIKLFYNDPPLFHIFYSFNYVNSLTLTCL